MAPASPARIASWAFFSRVGCSARPSLRPTCLARLLGALVLPHSSLGCGCSGLSPACVARKEVEVDSLGEAVSIERISRRLMGIRFRIHAIWKGEKSDYASFCTMKNSATCGQIDPAWQFHLAYTKFNDRRGVSDHLCGRTSTTAESKAHQRHALGRPRWMPRPAQEQSNNTHRTAANTALRSGGALLCAALRILALISIPVLTPCRKPSLCR